MIASEKSVSSRQRNYTKWPWKEEKMNLHFSSHPFFHKPFFTQLTLLWAVKSCQCLDQPLSIHLIFPFEFSAEKIDVRSTDIFNLFCICYINNFGGCKDHTT